MAADLAGPENKVMAEHMEKNGEKRNNLPWVGFVKENFETTPANLKERNWAFPPEAPSLKTEPTATPKECELLNIF